MEKKPNQDAMEAMKEMVQHAMQGGCTREWIIRDIMGWGEDKGITEIMILDAIGEWQKNNEVKPSSPVIRESSFPIHSPKDFPEPVKPVEKKPLGRDMTKMTEKEKELELLKYAKGAVIGRNAPIVDTLIKMVKTRRAYFQSQMTDDFLTFMCNEIFEENLRLQMKELKRKHKKGNL